MAFKTQHKRLAVDGKVSYHSEKAAAEKLEKTIPQGWRTIGAQKGVWAVLRLPIYHCIA
jgi:hypothetical protein